MIELQDTAPDEDEEQEYQCLILEGYGEEEARRLARGAGNRANRERMSGPRSHDSKGHGERPYITDTTRHEYAELDSFTMDSRTDEQREHDCVSSDFARDLLSRLTSKQREVIDVVYGITTGDPMSWQAAADYLGVTRNTVEYAVRSGVEALRLHTGVEKPDEAAARRKKRAAAARARYAAQKGDAVRKYGNS